MVFFTIYTQIQQCKKYYIFFISFHSNILKDASSTWHTLCIEVCRIFQHKLGEKNESDKKNEEHYQFKYQCKAR